MGFRRRGRGGWSRALIPHPFDQKLRTPSKRAISKRQARLAEEGGDPLFSVKRAFTFAHRRVALLSR